MGSSIAYSAPSSLNPPLSIVYVKKIIIKHISNELACYTLTFSRFSKFYIQSYRLFASFWLANARIWLQSEFSTKLFHLSTFAVYVSRLQMTQTLFPQKESLGNNTTYRNMRGHHFVVYSFEHNLHIWHSSSSLVGGYTVKFSILFWNWCFWSNLQKPQFLNKRF